MPTVEVSELFDPSAWNVVEDFDFQDITYHRAVDHGSVRMPSTARRSAMPFVPSRSTSCTPPSTTPA